MQRHLLSFPVFICLLSCSPSPGGDGSVDENNSIVQSIAGQSDAVMTITPAGDALDRSFRPLYEDSPQGPQIVVLEGDPDNGPSLTLFRYERNYAGSGNLHFHTHDYRLWLIEGELKHWGEAESENDATVLGPGSYIHQPGRQIHAANCIAEQCTAYVMFNGPIKTGFPDDRQHQ